MTPISQGVFKFQALFFLGNVFYFKGLLAVFQELIALLIVLGLSDLILGAELTDFNLAA